MSRLDQGVPEPNWVNFVGQHDVGDVLDGRVTKVLPFGAFVEIAEGVAGLLVGAASSAEVDARVSVRIKEIDTVKRRLSFSSAG